MAVCRLQKDHILLNIKFFWQFPCCPRNIHGVVCLYVVVIHVMKITRINLLTALEVHVSNIYLWHKCIYIYCSRVFQLNFILLASHSRRQAF